MIVEAALGFLFIVAWGLFYLLIIGQRSTLRALAGVVLLFGAMALFNRYRFQGSLSGWLVGTSVGFFTALWLVQKHGPEKPTDGAVIAILLFGPLVMVGMLLALLLL